MSPQEENAKMPQFNRPIKLLVCGGRRYANKDFVWEWLDRFSLTNEISHLIHGGARGADELASRWCMARGIQQVIVPVNWEAHGVAGGPLRNRAMALLGPDLCLAFPGGNGTKSMVAISRGHGIKVIEISELFKETGS